MNVRIPMKFTEIEVGGVEPLIANDAWVFEQKFDGTHGLCVITKNNVWWPGSGGVGSLKHTAAIQHFAALKPHLLQIFEALVGDIENGEVVLDGEIMILTGQYHIWDVVAVRGGFQDLGVHQDEPYSVRHKALNTLDIIGLLQGPVHMVRTAVGSEAKRELWNAVKDGGGEGVVAKRLDSRYQPGVRVTDWLKLKFVKTADVVVLEVNRPDVKHGNFKLGCALGAVPPGDYVVDAVIDGVAMVRVGGCSAIGKDPAVKVGDVIEVAYLYWTGTNIYQPRMLKIREDKRPIDCLVSQFPVYSREAR